MRRPIRRRWAAERPRFSHYRGGGRIIELLGSEVLHRDEELLYTVWAHRPQIGQFADRRRARRSCARPRSS